MDVLQIFEVDSGEVLITLEGHTDVVRCVCFSPDGSRLVSGGDDNTAIVSAFFHHCSAGGVRGWCGGQCIIFLLEHLKVWDPTSGKVLDRIGFEENVKRVGFSPDGSWIMLIVGDKLEVRCH